MSRPRASREGMALLTVLLLVAVMAVVAVDILDDVRFSVRRTTNAETQAQAQWYAAGAESLARRQIADLIKADAARTPLEPRWNGRVMEVPVEEGAVRAVVTVRPARGDGPVHRPRDGAGPVARPRGGGGRRPDRLDGQ